MYRKRVLLICTLFLIVYLSLAGCMGSESSTEPIDESTTEETENEEADHSETNEEAVDPSKTSEFNQSPILDDQDLPSIEERLPNEPKLTNEMPPELLDYEIGQYGGTMRTVSHMVEWDPEFFVMNNEPLVNTPGILGEEITGNILLDYEVSDDQQEFTFYMREGLQWSDGAPVTVEDIRFTIEDVIFNEELTPSVPAWLRGGNNADGEPMSFDIVDDYAFTITFEQPYGGFLIQLAIQGWRGYTDLLKPAHYLKDYHIDYTPLEKLESDIEAEGFDTGDWIGLFQYKDIENQDMTEARALGFPSLYPWLMVESSDTVTRYERNPYYFKVDEEGNQLPYIDEVHSNYVADLEMINMSIISGEADVVRSSTGIRDMALYRENEENGNYDSFLTDFHVTPTDVHLNLTYDDPVWREVVRDVRFRKALNMAIDRDEIIDGVYYGFAEPGTLMDSTYDMEEANRILDEMGMEEGSDGVRQAPGGEPFSIDIEVGGQAPDILYVTELIVEYWSELGLDVSMRTIDDTLWSTRVDANELQATVMWSHIPLWYHSDWSQNLWAPLWHRWYTTEGEEGEEPPEDIKRLYDLINQVNQLSPEEGMQAIEEVEKEMSEHMWFISHTESVQQPMMVNKNLGNVTSEGFGMAVSKSAEQFFFKE